MCLWGSTVFETDFGKHFWASPSLYREMICGPETKGDLLLGEPTDRRLSAWLCFYGSCSAEVPASLKNVPDIISSKFMGP